MVKAMGKSAGFSLIELMVAMAVLLLILGDVMQTFIVQQRTYVVVDQVTETQQTLRAVADLIERDVRRAGYMVPPHAAVCGYDATTGPDTLFVSNTDVFRTVFDLESGGEDVSGNLGAPVTGVGSTWSASGGSFDLNLSQLWVDVAADGDDFAVGAGVIVVDRNDETGQIACGVIASIAGNVVNVDFGNTTTGIVGLNADVVAVPAHVYTLTPPAGGTPGKLRRDGALLGSDVEDFQVTYFLDLNDDRIVDPGESFGTAGGTADPYAQVAASFPDPTSLREIQINLVTVTRDDDPNREFTLGAGQVTGNRQAASLPSDDRRRRRVHSARVRLRNTG
jgi:prepilin-type N-terminal cleavage/methylation domain-containing protein